MRSRKVVILLSTALVFSLVALYAPAQTVTGTLSGHITDPSGAIVPKVTVKALNESTGGVREAVTNDDGYFQINFVPIGTYDLTVSLTGFRTIDKQGVVIELNKTTVSDFKLGVATVATSVEVQGGELPLIDTTTGEVKSTLNEQQVEATPLPGRNFISLVEQVPGFQPAAFNSSSNNPTNSTGLQRARPKCRFHEYYGVPTTCRFLRSGTTGRSAMGQADCRFHDRADGSPKNLSGYSPVRSSMGSYPFRDIGTRRWNPG